MKCIYFNKDLQIFFLNMAKILRFREFSQMISQAFARHFRKLLHTVNMVSQCSQYFAIFRKVLQFVVLQSLAKFCKVLQIDFRKFLRVGKSWSFTRFCNGQFANVRQVT